MRARSGLANLLPATGGSPRCLRQLGSPPAIFLLPLRGHIAPCCAGQAKATFLVSESAARPVISAAAGASRTAALPEPIPVAVESAAATPAAKRARFLLACLIHRQWASFQDFPVQLADGRFHIGFGSQFYKSKSPRTTCFLIAHQFHIRNRNAGAGKKLI